MLKGGSLKQVLDGSTGSRYGQKGFGGSDNGAASSVQKLIMIIFKKEIGAPDRFNRINRC